MFCAKNRPVPEWTTDFEAIFPLMTFLSVRAWEVSAKSQMLQIAKTSTRSLKFRMVFMIPFPLDKIFENISIPYLLNINNPTDYISDKIIKYAGWRGK
jgi:hypothetical protein